MALPVTLAMIAANVGLPLVDRFISSRRDKQAEAAQRRKDAMNKLISSLSSRGEQRPQQERQRQEASPLQIILRDPMVRDLLAQKLGGLTNPKKVNSSSQVPM
jgi:hypothetical protein